MKKTVMEHNTQLLHDFVSRIENYKWLTFDGASEANQFYLKTHDNSFKEYLLNGVQYIIYQIIQGMSINFGDQTIIDLEDIISYLNLYFLNGIENGIFIDAKSLEDIISKDVIAGMYKYMFQGVESTVTKTTLDEADQIAISEPRFDNIENKMFIGDFLRRVDEEGILYTRDKYNKDVYGDKAEITGKRTVNNFFETDRLSDGLLKDVVRNHPMFDQEREAAAEILADARTKRYN